MNSITPKKPNDKEPSSLQVLMTVLMLVTLVALAVNQVDPLAYQLLLEIWRYLPRR